MQIRIFESTKNGVQRVHFAHLGTSQGESRLAIITITNEDESSFKKMVEEALFERRGVGAYSSVSTIPFNEQDVFFTIEMAQPIDISSIKHFVEEKINLKGHLC